MATAATDRIGPELSVVVATPFGFGSVRRLVQYLAGQTVRDRLEVVFVVPHARGFQVEPAAVDPFAGAVVLETGPFASVNRARVAGMRRASAPLVAFVEDHCFPAPRWAEALIEAHRAVGAGPRRAAVGPVVGLANRHSARAWSNYLIQYCGWMRPHPGGPVDDLPGHNSSYKKDVLLAYGDRLEETMEFEFVLHQDLRSRGWELWLAPAAETFHTFMTRVGPYLKEHVAIGQSLAAHRARRFSVPHRVARAVTSPLLPLVRGARIWRAVRARGWHRRLFPRVVPWLAVGLVTNALGELLGYTLGPGSSARWTLDIDFARERFVSEDERARLWGPHPVDLTATPAAPAFGRARA